MSVSTLLDLDPFAKAPRFPIPESEPEEGEILEPSQIIIDGLMEAGDKMIIGGSSKSYKPWSFIDLGLSIANGAEWWGHKCQEGSVLYCNFEIKPKNFWKRVFAVRRARGFEKTPGFKVWQLRGKGFTMDEHRKE